MARRDQDDQPATSKAVNSAYTGMLAISLLALLVGCALLYLDYNQYGGDPKGIPKAPAPQQPEK